MPLPDESNWRQAMKVGGSTKNVTTKMTDDDYRLQCTLMIREIFDKKLSIPSKMMKLCHTSPRILSEWRKDDPDKWITAEKARTLLPILEVEFFSNPPTRQQPEKTITSTIEPKTEKLVEKEKPKTFKPKLVEPAYLNDHSKNNGLIPLHFNLIKQDQYTVDTLLKMYQQRIGPITEDVELRLKDYFRHMAHVSDEWWKWAHEGMAICATKVTASQRGIGYLLGIYKSWLKWGFGSNFSAESQKLVETFEKRFGIEPSPDSMRKLHSIIASYGLVFTIEAIYSIDKPPQTDISLLIANDCEKYLNERTHR